MTVAYDREIAPPDHVGDILGCRLEDGACVVHQPRPWDPRRAGCPFRDQIEREAAYQAARTRRT